MILDDLKEMKSLNTVIYKIWVALLTVIALVLSIVFTGPIFEDGYLTTFETCPVQMK